MKLEESTVLVVLHSFLSTFGFRTCYRVEDHPISCSSLGESATFIMLSQEKYPASNLLWLDYQKDFKN
jgi:hypothetical protein